MDRDALRGLFALVALVFAEPEPATLRDPSPPALVPDDDPTQPSARDPVVAMAGGDYAWDENDYRRIR